MEHDVVIKIMYAVQQNYCTHNITKTLKTRFIR